MFFLLSLCLVLQACTDCFTFCHISTCTISDLWLYFQDFDSVWQAASVLFASSDTDWVLCWPAAPLTNMYLMISRMSQLFAQPTLLFSSPAVWRVKSREEVFFPRVYIYITVHTIWLLNIYLYISGCICYFNKWIKIWPIECFQSWRADNMLFYNSTVCAILGYRIRIFWHNTLWLLWH